MQPPATKDESQMATMHAETQARKPASLFMARIKKQEAGAAHVLSAKRATYHSAMQAAVAWAHDTLDKRQKRSRDNIADVAWATSQSHQGNIMCSRAQAQPVSVPQPGIFLHPDQEQPRVDAAQTGNVSLLLPLASAGMASDNDRIEHAATRGTRPASLPPRPEAEKEGRLSRVMEELQSHDFDLLHDGLSTLSQSVTQMNEDQECHMKPFMQQQSEQMASPAQSFSFVNLQPAVSSPGVLEHMVPASLSSWCNLTPKADEFPEQSAPRPFVSARMPGTSLADLMVGYDVDSMTSSNKMELLKTCVNFIWPDKNEDAAPGGQLSLGQCPQQLPDPCTQQKKQRRRRRQRQDEPDRQRSWVCAEMPGRLTKQRLACIPPQQLPGNT
eukprot:359258-Chlamydomonas_euryale.AAC.13